MEERIMKLFPRLADITNSSLRGTVIEIWKETVEQSEFSLDDLEASIIPFTLLISELVENGIAQTTFVDHTNEVTEAAICLATSLNRSGAGIDMDNLIAAANLHDVGKLLEYSLKDGAVVQNQRGKMLRHPFLGAAVATKYDLPLDVIQAIFGHSKEMADEKRSLLCRVVNRADFFYFTAIKEYLVRV